MMFPSTKILALALIGCVTASPVELHKRDQGVIIGYRTVAASQAKRYNDAGTLTDDKNIISTQLGEGVYTSPDRGGWLGGLGSWYCVILADPKALDRVSKAWVPEQHEGKKLWYNKNAINDYIKQLNRSWDPAKTLRLSIISGKGYNDVQMLIPPALLNSNGGGMGITASCVEDMNEIPDYHVNYDDWKNNINGDREESGDDTTSAAPFIN